MVLLSSVWRTQAADELEERHAPSRGLLLGLGILTSWLQGGGLIFGFSAFADELTKLPNSPYTSEDVSDIFAVGHNIASFGCIISGAAVDHYGPRVCTIVGLIMEAVGHQLLAHAVHLPPWSVMAAYGLLGWGGCQVFLGALTFTGAFQHSNVVSSVLTCAFQAGGFVFMALPHVPWRTFFQGYFTLSIAMAVLVGLLYPDVPPTCDSNVSEETRPSTPLRKLLVTPRVTWFLLTFMVGGSAYIYGSSEIPAALRVKDTCTWNEAIGDFVNCKDQLLQDDMNLVQMPLAGNFIFPFSSLLGMVMERWGYAFPAFLCVFSIQAFLAALWLFDLHGQYATLLIYNITTSTLWTMQNAYICAIGAEHIGSLFAISNLVLSIGNLLSDWLSMDPFGEGSEKGVKSLRISCTFWLVVTIPLYAWAVAEIRHQRCIRTSRIKNSKQAAEHFSPRIGGTADLLKPMLSAAQDTLE